MTFFKTLTIAAIGLAVSAFATIERADAATVACNSLSPNVTGNLSPNAGCQINPDIDNDPTGGQGKTDFLNAAFFGHEDWIFDSRDNNVDGVETGSNTLGVSYTGVTPRQSGDYSFSKPLTGLDVMMVFKGGDKSFPNGLVAYLVSAATGSFTTPFFKNADGTGPQDISHISVYYRTSDMAPVPLPAAAWLLLSGMGGLGLMGWRKRRAFA